MKKIWLLFYVILQCTWGIFQTLAGLIVFLRYLRNPHKWYHGAIHTKWDGCGGVSLGLFIFTPTDEGNDRKISTLRCRELTVHEYGHTYQSLILGPFYLLIIGIPSMIWERAAKYNRLRAEYGVPYSFCFTERWADYFGEKVTGQKSSG